MTIVLAAKSVCLSSGHDVAFNQHSIKYDPWQDHHIGNFTTLDTFAEVAGFSDGDAHLLASDPYELRLKFIYDFSHATGTQDLDFGSVHCIRCEADCEGQACGQSFGNHRCPHAFDATREHRSLDLNQSLELSGASIGGS